jgi:arsenate reductase (thioredoxin)
MRVRDALKRYKESGAEKAPTGDRNAWRSPSAPVNEAASIIRSLTPAQASAPLPEKKKVIFVCLGNACRSQMAEAFAVRYGSDILEVASAGLNPAAAVPDLTRAVMKDKGISLDGHFSKGTEVFQKIQWDLVINMSGRHLVSLQTDKTVSWKIDDPMGQRQIVHERVRDEIENLVMRLILELRAQAKRPS